MALVEVPPPAPSVIPKPLVLPPVEGPLVLLEIDEPKPVLAALTLIEALLTLLVVETLELALTEAVMPFSVAVASAAPMLVPETPSGAVPVLLACGDDEASEQPPTPTRASARVMRERRNQAVAVEPTTCMPVSLTSPASDRQGTDFSSPA